MQYIYIYILYIYIYIYQARRNEKSSRGELLRIMKYCCRPPWLADEKNFAFQIV